MTYIGWKNRPKVVYLFFEQILTIKSSNVAVSVDSRYDRYIKCNYGLIRFLKTGIYNIFEAILRSIFQNCIRLHDKKCLCVYLRKMSLFWAALRGMEQSPVRGARPEKMQSRGKKKGSIPLSLVDRPRFESVPKRHFIWLLSMRKCFRDPVTITNHESVKNSTAKQGGKYNFGGQFDLQQYFWTFLKAILDRFTRSVCALFVILDFFNLIQRDY